MFISTPIIRTREKVSLVNALFVLFLVGEKDFGINYHPLGMFLVSIHHFPTELFFNWLNDKIRIFECTIWQQNGILKKGNCLKGIKKKYHTLTYTFRENKEGVSNKVEGKNN